MSQIHASSSMNTSATRSTRSLLAALSVAAGVLFAPVAQAAVISSPATIVDHGEYITDTANHRDWYKFNNALSTVGWSFADWMWIHGWNGWSGATLGQVQGLETQFGWTGDTPDYSVNANYGLTDAMAYYLGYTTDGENVIGDLRFFTFRIQAMTSDAYIENNDVRVQVTLSEMNGWEDAHHQYYFNGDYVDGTNTSLRQLVTEGDPLTGIWLTRASVDDGGGGGAAGDCGLTAPCPPVDVPEPTSGVLLTLGLVVLGTLRRTRYATVERK